ncbi:MAG: FkbM family methyltransferase [Planctomycetota bacterium]
MKRLEKKLKSTLYNGLALARWGTLYPTAVRPHRSVSPITFNPRDPRARKKLIHDTVRRNIPRNRAFWNRAIAQLQPQTALDVGVNYGECLFTAKYPDASKAFGFEANPSLKTYLDQTHAAHPDADRIALRFGLAGSAHGGHAEFHVDTQWSGSSSAVQYIDDPSRYQTIQAPLISIDGSLADAEHHTDTLVFKIDVEGYESFVLDGMTDTLSKARWVVGLIEINEVSAKAAGIELAEYFDRLQQRFGVWAFNRQAKLTDLRGQGLDALTAACQKPGRPAKKIGTDLVLTAGEHTPEIDHFIGSWS